MEVVILNRPVAPGDVGQSSALPYRVVRDDAPDADSANDISRTEIQQPAVNTYELQVIRQIDAWKTQGSGRLGNVLNRLSRPIGWGLSRLMPESAINAAISAAYWTSQWLADSQRVEPLLGPTRIADLRGKSLELSDGLAARVRHVAQTAAFIDGAVTGMAGLLLAPVDVGALTVVALNAIHRTGHCYGFSLDQPEDRPYVLAILMLAGTDAVHERQQLFARLQDFRGWVLARTIETIAMESLTRQFVQLTALEAIPGIGIALGAAVNLFFIRRVLTDCQRVFQQRWLQENGRISAATTLNSSRSGFVPGGRISVSGPSNSPSRGLATPAKIPA
jgi:hypothetical protein